MSERNYISTSASREVAESFLYQNEDSNPTNKFQLRTMLKIVKPQLLSCCVDVSWLSPFSNERELIVQSNLNAVFEPTKWNINTDLKNWNGILVKTVILRPERSKESGDISASDCDNYFKILRENVHKLQEFRSILTEIGLLRIFETQNVSGF